MMARAAAELSAQEVNEAAKDKYQAVKDNVAHGFDNAKEQISQTASGLMDTINEKSQTIGDKVKSFTADALERGGYLIDNLADKAHSAADKLRK